MAEIITNEHGAKKGKKRAKKHPAHIDMTPMVDLACLLLTFFMLTAAFTKPKVMEIVMPKREGPAQPIPGPKVITIILDGNNRVFYYSGLADPNKVPLPVVYQSEFGDNGIRKILLNRNKVLYAKIDSFNSEISKGKIQLSKEKVENTLKKLRTADKSGPIVLIKATDKAKYKNIVDMLNEMAVTNIARYTIADLSNFEERLLAKTKRDLKISD